MSDSGSGDTSGAVVAPQAGIVSARAEPAAGSDGRTSNPAAPGGGGNALHVNSNDLFEFKGVLLARRPKDSDPLFFEATHHLDRIPFIPAGGKPFRDQGYCPPKDSETTCERVGELFRSSQTPASKRAQHFTRKHRKYLSTLSESVRGQRGSTDDFWMESRRNGSSADTTTHARLRRALAAAPKNEKALAAAWDSVMKGDGSGPNESESDGREPESFSSTSTMMNPSSFDSTKENRFRPPPVRGAHQDPASPSAAHSDDQSAQSPQLNSKQLQQHKQQRAKPSKESSSRKPAWALTEAEAEEVEEGELENLLDFANNLNFDDFISDLEVRQAVEKLKERVSVISSEPKQRREVRPVDERPRNESSIYRLQGEDGPIAGQDSSTGDVLEPSVRALAVPGTFSSPHRGSESEDEHESASMKSFCENRSLSSVSSFRSAAEILDMNPKMAKVHSKRSVARMLEQEADRKAAREEEEAAERGQATHTAPTLQELRMIVHGATDRAPRFPVAVEESAATRFGKRERPLLVSNLPYLYRCPAI